MVEITAKQAGTILVAIIFLGSTFAYALNWALPQENNKETPENIFKSPISSSQRQNFIGEDKTVVLLFYTSKNEDSAKVKKSLEEIAKALGDNFVLEEINVRTSQSFAAEYNVRYVPVVLIKGKNNRDSPRRLEGFVKKNKLKDEICKAYESKPQFCR